jgi:hypothetical protein
MQLALCQLINNQPLKSPANYRTQNHQSRAYAWPGGGGGGWSSLAALASAAGDGGAAAGVRVGRRARPAVVVGRAAVRARHAPAAHGVVADVPSGTQLPPGRGADAAAAARLHRARARRAGIVPAVRIHHRCRRRLAGRTRGARCGKKEERRGGDGDGDREHGAAPWQVDVCHASAR